MVGPARPAMGRRARAFLAVCGLSAREVRFRWESALSKRLLTPPVKPTDCRHPGLITEERSEGNYFNPHALMEPRTHPLNAHSVCHGKPSETYAKNRRCTQEGCVTILCSYNPGPDCFIHTPGDWSEDIQGRDEALGSLIEQRELVPA